MKDNIQYVVIGLFGGIILTWLFASMAVNNNNQGMMRMMGMRSMMTVNQDYHGSMMNNAMQGMMTGLQNLSGDEFDRAFLSEMIIHHEGAIQMAQAASINANHEEIKNLAKEIIEAQSKEIAQMKAWQQEWYK